MHRIAVRRHDCAAAQNAGLAIFAIIKDACLPGRDAGFTIVQAD